MEPNIEVNLDNVFFKSYTVDPNCQCPIFVFDSTYLPSTDQIEDREVYDLLINETMNKLVAKLPDTPFSLVVFSSGFSQNNISWIYGVKMYSKIPKTTRAKIRKFMIVHESLFVRTVYQVLSNALNINPFKAKQSSSDSIIIQHLSNLEELAGVVDITKLRMSLNVYLYDYHLTETTDISYSPRDPKSALANRQYRQLVFDKIFKRLRIEAPRHQLVFQRPGSYQKVNILLGVIARNNYVDLSQWDIYSLGTIFLNFIKGKSKPIFSIDLIPLPISECVDYTYNTFVNMMMHNGYYELTSYIFELFLALLDNSETTLHDYKSLSKCLTPTLYHEKVSMKSSDRLAIGYRYTNNVLMHFRELKQRIELTGDLAAPSIQAVNANLPSRLANNAPKVPPPRKASPVRSTSSRAMSPTRSTSSSVTHFDKSADAPTRAPPLPRRADQESQQEIRQSSTPILRPDSPSVTSTDSFNTENSMPSSAATNDDLYSEEAVEFHQKLTLSPRIASGSSIHFDESGTNTELRLISEEAVRSRPRVPNNEFEIDQSKMNLLLKNNEKIRKFDKELRKKKQQAADPNFSSSPSKGYSDIRAGNKVSQLAALYEERLIGIRVMEDMRRNQ
ncbi:LAME_0G03312g1_1 [Lachancea meyersii CBS 8951]|uniref:LAME_0G03312g1_1 n=1 Tax=Lachancea meyersii CBS 8951 TaxID=1266667 RepID=A0A1G4K6J2_9SACH|nr:LAME_0G03312g1_1 [Lachancea meyersii CBS 8951]